METWMIHHLNPGNHLNQTRTKTLGDSKNPESSSKVVQSQIPEFGRTKPYLAKARWGSVGFVLNHLLN